MRIRPSVRFGATGLAALVLALSGTLIFEGRSGAGLSAGAASARELEVFPAGGFPITTLGTYSTPEFPLILWNNGSSTDTIDLTTDDVSISGPGANDFVITPGNCPGNGVSTITPHLVGEIATELVILPRGGR